MVAQLLLGTASVVLAALAAVTYGAGFDDVVRDGSETLAAFPSALERAYPDAPTFSFDALDQWKSDPMLVDRIGAYAGTRQFVDSCGSKEEVWHAHALRDELGDLPPDFFRHPPYLHLSGSSYVMLAIGMEPERYGNTEFLHEHRAYLHVTELEELGRFGVEGLREEQWLAGLSDESLHALAEGVGVLLGERFVFVGIRSWETSPHYRVYPRAQVDRFLLRRGLAARTSAGACVRTLDKVCFESDPRLLENRVVRAQGMGAGSVALLLGAGALGLWRRQRDKRQEQESRAFVLQTLSHELRTPATSLALSVEPVREHFDELPDAVQPAFLRICDSVQRLQRMVEASGQYLRGEALSFRPVNVQDVGALLAELADEFEVKTVNRLNRSEARLDAYWLRVCVRNLLENAVRHGVRPVEMQLDNDDDRLLVSVQDAGRGLDRSLNHAVQPFVSCAGSQGLGFGLAVVHRMVGAMGGRLSYRSNPTRFRVELPGVLR